MSASSGEGVLSPFPVPAVPSGSFGGMLSVGKKSGGRDADDDLASMTGGLGKSKSKSGGGGKGSKTSAGAGAAIPEAAAASAPLSLGDALAVSGTSASSLVPDRDVSVGFMQRMPLGAAVRMVGLFHVRGKAVARVTRLALPAGTSGVGSTSKPLRGGRQDTGSQTPSAAAATIDAAALLKACVCGVAPARAGGASALHVLASQLLQQLQAYGADVASLPLHTPSKMPFATSLGSLITLLPPLHPQNDLRPPVSDLDVVAAFSRSSQVGGVVFLMNMLHFPHKNCVE
jgi:hypothetical protein